MSDDDESVDESVGNTLSPVITRARATPQRMHDIRTAARAYRELALETLADVMQTGRDTAKVSAALGLLAYSDGKPHEGTAMVSAEGTPVLDLGRLTSDELRTMLELTRKAKGSP